MDDESAFVGYLSFCSGTSLVEVSKLQKDEHMRALGTLLLVVVLAGCTTMQHLDDVGEDYSKGNYISGTALLVFITPFTLIADIFTFGGSMDAQQSSAVWTGAASQYAQNEAVQQQRDAERQQRVLEQQLRASALAEQQAQAAQAQYAQTFQQQDYDNQPAAQRASYSSEGGANQAEAVNSCVAIQPNPNIPEARHMVNTCSFAIRVTYCTEGVVASGNYKGRRVDECAKGMWSAKSLVAGGRELHNYNHVGVSTVFIACPDPYYAPGSKISYANGVAQGRCQK